MSASEMIKVGVLLSIPVVVVIVAYVIVLARLSGQISEREEQETGIRRS